MVEVWPEKYDYIYICIWSNFSFNPLPQMAKYELFPWNPLTSIFSTGLNIFDNKILKMANYDRTNP